MSRTLSEMRTDVRILLDDLNSDPDQARWTDAVVDVSIQRALTSVAIELFNNGWEDIISSTSVTPAATGIATVPSNDGILDVSQNLNNTLVRVRRATAGSSSTPFSSGTFTINYLAKTEIPNTDSGICTYGDIDIDDPLVDQYTAYLAASDLKTTEGEPNPLINAKLPELSSRIKAKYTPLSSAYPITAPRRYLTITDLVRYQRKSSQTVYFYLSS